MEFLKDLLNEETYTQLQEQLKDKDIKLVNLKEGGYVDVDKYKTTVKDLEDTRLELEDRTNKLTELSNNENASQEIKDQLEKLKEDFEQKEADYKAKLIQNEINAKVDKAVLKSGTVDEVAVKAHLQSFLNEAEYKDGVIVGLDEQLKELKENKEHLFKNETVVTGVKHKKAVKADSIEDELRRSMGVKPKSK